MKSVVVIDTPENCRRCPFRFAPWSFCLGEYEKENHCPLRPLPSKLVPFGYLDAGNEDGLYEKGYNDCIDEITGETE